MLFRHEFEPWFFSGAGEEFGKAGSAGPFRATQDGDGRIRTPVPVCFKTGIYIIGHISVLSPPREATDSTGKRNMQAVFNEPDDLNGSNTKTLPTE
jgi:hypothetical protein